VSQNILIVDDNIDFCSTLAEIVRSQGWKPIMHHSPEDAIAFLEKNANSVSLMFLDIEFGDRSRMTGLDMLAHTVKHFFTVPVVMISGKGTIETAVLATKIGAVNFIEKSILAQDKIIDVLKTASESIGGKSKNIELLRFLEEQGIIGNSPQILEVGNKILNYARTDLNVLVSGETGTGKKLVAKALHAASRRSKNMFVTVDIPNIPREIFQSELYGHVRGAFTGAMDNKKGLFHQATKGTLFLDEIGDLSTELQANLLLPIEEKIVRKVGSVEPEKIDVRFVSATDKDLVAAIKEGKFREQLYHRLRECEIYIPPLRQRKDDIPLIIEYYTKVHNTDFEQSKSFTPSAIDYLKNREWNGNIRELYSSLRVALQTIMKSEIELSDLHNALSHTSTLYLDTTQNSLEQNPLIFSTDRSLKEDISLVDKMKIESTLKVNNGNVSKTAAMLNVSRETLHNKIRRYEINVQQYRK